MRITLDVSRSLAHNAETYFERSKKERRKAAGARDAIERLKKQEVRKEIVTRREKKAHWFMKHRWFFTSSGKLVVGGRDADSNEEVVKKRAGAFDRVFHTDVPGSPFFILKLGRDEQASDTDIQEVADATVSFSRAWRYGANDVDVFHVASEQVSKRARPGEFLGKGSFMIYGEKSFAKGSCLLFVSLYPLGDDRFVLSTPYPREGNIKILPGKRESAEVARELVKRFADASVTIDEVVRMLPSGGIEVVE